jgi:hypothetical protein
MLYASAAESWQSHPLCGGAGCGHFLLLLLKAGSLILSAEVLAVGNAFCFCCRKLTV